MRASKDFFQGNTVRILLCLALSLALAACASTSKDKAALLQKEIASLQKQGQRLDSTQERITYFQRRDKLVQQLFLEGYRHLYQKDYVKADAAFHDALSIAPDHAESRKGLELIASHRAADGYVEQALQLKKPAPALALGAAEKALQLNPLNAEARLMRNTLLTEKALADRNAFKLSDALTTPISLELKDVAVVNALELLSQSSGINFILDKDVRSDLRTTIFVRNTAIKDVLALIFKTSQLQGKPLNASTYLIYPKAADKAKQYEDLVIKTYFLDSQNGKKVMEQVQALVNPKFIYLDEPSAYITVRDTQDVLNVVDRLVAVADVIKPEVVLEVEILEISSDKIKNLGIQFPTTVTGSLSPLAQTANGFTGYKIEDLKNLTRDSWRIGLPDPALIANLKYQDGAADILASPKIRVQNLEKAKILLGDKVPVITTTVNQTSSSVTESISYLDVGLKLEATPIVHPSGDVTINMDLEVSNIVKEVRSTTGLLTYQIGTRSTHTSLRSRNGETQMLAGLIKNEQRESASRLPLLGQIPWLGKLFSNESDTRNKTEIVLLITPHIVRGQSTPAAHDAQFISGSLENAGTDAFLLGDAGVIRMGERAQLPFTSTALNEPAAVPKLVDLNASQHLLSLLAPEAVGPDQEFVVTLAADTPLHSQDRLEYRFNPAQFELTGATPIDASSQLELEREPGLARLHFKGGASGQGPLAILAMKARGDFQGTGRLSVSMSPAGERNERALKPAEAVVRTNPKKQ